MKGDYMHNILYLHLLGEAVGHTGFRIDDLIHEWLSQTGVVQLIVTPARV
jgi:hypothetical protein